MAIELENVLPSEIEKRSFEIITEELTQIGSGKSTGYQTMYPYKCRF